MRSPESLSQPELDLLLGLVSIPSPTGRVVEAATWLVGRLQQLGVTAELDSRGSVRAIVEPGPVEPQAGELYLLGHLDTVEGFWQPRIEHGRLSGRGASDAKGPLAAFVLAALRARDSGRLRRRVRILAVADEEGESEGAHWLVTNLPPPEFLVVGEPSGSDRIVLGYRGRLRCRWELSCPTQHSSRPEPTTAERGISAWSAVVAEVAAINGEAAGFDAIDAHLLAIESHSDGLQDTVTLQLGFRLPPAVGPGDLIARLHGLALGGRLQMMGAEAAAVVPRVGILPTAFVRAITADGAKASWQRRLATSDLNVVLPGWQCPAVVYGPGDSALDHTPEEAIDLADFARGTRVLTRVLLAL
ncbi:MAG TPA: M20/M25/M40 family metallo-hydrolase [Candidatus Dormibacteraeota bacterium]|nr:M20/M25/M40 family metallo-hydrolase [Candidatus Dormibacteraeota bacterium]